MAEGHDRNTGTKFLAIIAVIIAITALVWVIMADGKARDAPKKAETSQESEVPNEANVPSEPSNPNVTGGSTGVGTGTGNDSPSETPSPAGGVDTNNQWTNEPTP